MRNTQKGEWNISKLEGLNVYSQMTGKNVPLKQVADIVVEWQYSRIKRRDIERTVTILADVRSGYNVADITGETVAWLKDEKKNWGGSYSYSLGGEDEEMADAMDAVVKNFPLSIFLILLLLIAQFNSLRKTVIVLLTIPLGLIGVVIGLLVAQSYFGFLTLLGVVSLSGIVVNNGIVLLDRIKIELEEFGRSAQEAIIVAAQQRFRPILLTTATTSFGLLPLWFGGGGMWPPMAISIIFGLIFGTIITLLFVPVMYKVLFRVSFKGYQNIN
jgi:multidrug efflux pump subunit AcrB